MSTDKSGAGAPAPDGAVLLRGVEEPAAVQQRCEDALPERLTVAGLGATAVICVACIGVANVVGREASPMLERLATAAMCLLGGYLSRTMKQGK
jgi:hypothetical protein